MTYTNTQIQNMFRQITILRATENDSKDIWKWRNDTRTRQLSIKTDEVSWEAHSEWYKNSLKNKKIHLYVGTINMTNKVGMCRFNIDKTKNSAEVSINLNPDFRNKKLSSLFLQKTIDIFVKTENINLTATIKKENTSSIKCFCSCNFKFDYEDETCNYYKLDINEINDIQNKLKLIDEIEKIRTANNIP